MYHRAPLLLVCALAACTGVARPPSPPRPPAAADGALAALRARDAQLSSLRAQFSVLADRDGGARRLNGLILAAKPDRARMRLMLPLGLTVFDYVRVGGAAWVVRPLAPPGQPAGAEPELPLHDIPLPVVSGAGGCAEQCEEAEPDPIGRWVRCYCSAAPRRVPSRFLLVRSADAAIVQERRFSGGQPGAIILSDDHRMTDGVLLPYRLKLSDARNPATSVTVTIDRYDVNPVLPDALFAPAAGAQPVALPAP
ncbi:MAG: hypothetical protein AB7N53_14955 [Candidatus Binatia bacterium]